MAAPPSRINPTLFDKLVGDTDLSGLRGDDTGKVEESRATMRYYSVPRLERFNEAALRATVRRELAWLLNTTNFEAVVDLTLYPNVRTSVLNYGVPDFAGKSMGDLQVPTRAREIRDAILAFEPRIDKDSLRVEGLTTAQRENASAGEGRGAGARENSITFVIHGDVRSAVRALPVQFRTDIEADTAAVTVRD